MPTTNKAKNKQPENTKGTGRNPDGTWQKGFCPNPGGRGKSPLKEFSLAEFQSWTPEQKKEFLNKINPYDRWRMTEGNPQNITDITSDGKPLSIQISQEASKKYDINPGTVSDTSGQPQI